MQHDFIRRYPAVIDKRTCAAATVALESQRFSPMALQDRVESYGEGQKHSVDDLHIELSKVELSLVTSDVNEMFGKFQVDLPNIIDSKVQEYMNEFSIAGQHQGKLLNLFYKMQMTDVGQSYSMWHSEWSSDYPSRFLVWMLYLNDIKEGGETEWFYYPKRIQPRAGDLVIWPAHFAHAHRGNPPLDKKKYVVTGWISSH